MSLRINTNTGAHSAHRALNDTQHSLGRSLEKLSSGMRINRAADDAAGLSISEGLRSQISGSVVASRNAQDAINMVQTAEGGLGEIHAILHRMRDLSVQAANDSNSVDSRSAIQNELQELAREGARLHDSLDFNGIKLLELSPTLTFQIGADGDSASTIRVQFPNVTAAVMDVITTHAGYAAPFKLDVTGGGDPALAHTAAQNAIEKIDGAITKVSGWRSDMGSAQNRLESASRSLSVSRENLSAAESRIRDTDMAEEMVKFTKAGILAQTGTAMLAQANQSGQGVLKLLG